MSLKEVLNVMKLLFAIIFVFLNFNNLFGQSYFAFPDSNCVWSVENVKYVIKGDSTYNSVNYKKYYKTTDSSLTFDSLKFVGLVRQDKLNKKIFGIPDTYFTEVLMYNFNLNLNDTVSVKPLIQYFWQTHRKLKVFSKDSVLINGQYRNRLKLGASSFPFPPPPWIETWVEGIGSSYGPLSSGLSDPPASCDCFPTLLCQKVGSLSVYINPIYNTCYKAICTTVNIFEQDNIKTLNIYPNPTTNVLNIDANVKSVLVYNSNLQLVQNVMLNKINPTIDVSKLPKGIYFIRVLTDKQIIEKKVVLLPN